MEMDHSEKIGHHPETRPEGGRHTDLHRSPSGSDQEMCGQIPGVQHVGQTLRQTNRRGFNAQLHDLPRVQGSFQGVCPEAARP